MKKVFFVLSALCSIGVFDAFAISKKKQAEIDAKKQVLEDLYIKPFTNFESDFKAKFDSLKFQSSYKSPDALLSEFSDLKKDAEKTVKLYNQRESSLYTHTDIYEYDPMLDRYIMSMYGQTLEIPFKKLPSFKYSKDVDFVICDFEINPEMKKNPFFGAEYSQQFKNELLNGYKGVANESIGDGYIYFGFNEVRTQTVLTF